MPVPPPQQSTVEAGAAPLEQCHQKNHDDDGILDVIVVGNGPSALALGALLQRRWVVGTGEAPSSSSVALKDAARVLAGRDLGVAGGPLLDGLGRRLPAARCVSPTSALVDALRFPVGDGGGASLLDAGERRLSSDDAAPLAVAVVGRGPPGGSWHARPGETLTDSPAGWMALPGLAWTAPPHPSGRATRGACAAYYARYAQEVLSPGTCVLGDATAAEVWGGLWRVATADGGERRSLRGRALVLATGAYDAPRRLGIPGEDLPLVVHRAPLAPRRRGERLLVVGAGLSAADAVLRWLSGGGAVVHVFRGAAKETRLYKMFGGGYNDAYAGECELASLAAGEAVHPDYQPVSHAQLTAVREDGTVDLEDACGGRVGDPKGATFDAVAVLVGGAPSLGFLPPALRERLPSAPLPPGTKLDGTPGTHPVHVRVDTATGLVLAEDGGGGALRDDPPLYALGPLRGDNFVRFVVGDAAAVANDLRRRNGGPKAGGHRADGMPPHSPCIQSER